MKSELTIKNLHPLDIEALEIYLSGIENEEWYKKLSPDRKLEYIKVSMNTYEFLKIRLGLSFREFWKSIDWVDFGMTILAVLISLGFFFGMFGSAILGVYYR